MTLPFNLDSVFKNVSQVRLKGGTVGKICHVLIFIAVAAAMISWSVRVVWVAFASLLLLFGLSGIVLWRLLNLAEKNPQAALMEGTEYLIHEQMMIGTKHDPLIPVSPSDLSESATLHLGIAETRQINQPDEEPQKQLRDGTQEESGVDNE